MRGIIQVDAAARMARLVEVSGFGIRSEEDYNQLSEARVPAREQDDLRVYRKRDFRSVQAWSVMVGHSSVLCEEPDGLRHAHRLHVRLHIVHAHDFCPTLTHPGCQRHGRPVAVFNVRAADPLA